MAEKNSDQSTECEGSTEVSAQLVKVQKNNIQSIEVKTAFLSSDDEETVSQVKKKRKKPLLLDSGKIFNYLNKYSNKLTFVNSDYKGYAFYKI